MKSKRVLLFRLGTVLVLLAIAAVMLIIGRGHTVYLDNQPLEYEGQTYETPYKIVASVGGEEVARLYERERGMATCTGQSLEVTLEITQVKDGEEELMTVTIPSPMVWTASLSTCPAIWLGCLRRRTCQSLSRQLRSLRMRRLSSPVTIWRWATSNSYISATQPMCVTHMGWVFSMPPRRYWRLL